MDSKKSKVTVIIPAHNEEKYISKVIEESKKYVDNVIIVDDDSTDKTSELAKKQGAIVIKHSSNSGLGKSLKTGCDSAVLLGSDILIILDGDGQHDPSEIPAMIKLLKSKEAGLVIGERDFKKIPLKKRVGNIFLSWMLKEMFDIKIKDTQSGYRAMTAETYRKIRWKSKDYSVASEILINLKNKNLKYATKKIKTIYHEKNKGTTILDGIKIAKNIIKLRLSSKNE